MKTIYISTLKCFDETVKFYGIPKNGIEFHTLGIFRNTFDDLLSKNHCFVESVLNAIDSYENGFITLIEVTFKFHHAFCNWNKNKMIDLNDLISDSNMDKYLTHYLILTIETLRKHTK